MELKCKRCKKTFTRSLSDINRGRTKFCGRICSDANKKEVAKMSLDRMLRLGKKQCHMCHKTRKLTKFPKSKNNLTGYFSYCYDCRRGINREQDARRRHSEKRKIDSRNNYLKRRYNITLEEYTALFIKQNGKCAICGIGADKSHAVDHCHRTGKIRGLLCENCNRGLGMFKDNPSYLKSAIKYLA